MEENLYAEGRVFDCYRANGVDVTWWSPIQRQTHPCACIHFHRHAPSSTRTLTIDWTTDICSTLCLWVFFHGVQPNFIKGISADRGTLPLQNDLNLVLSSYPYTRLCWTETFLELMFQRNISLVFVLIWPVFTIVSVRYMTTSKGIRKQSMRMREHGRFRRSIYLPIICVWPSPITILLEPTTVWAAIREHWTITRK